LTIAPLFSAVHAISVWYVLGNDDGSNGQE
jgi:hypothetical protein